MVIRHGYVSWLCIMAMYLWPCIMAMYHGYVMYYKQRSKRIQEGNCLNNSLKVVLIADSESMQKSVHNRTGIIDLQNDLNILVAKQWKI